MTPNQNHFGIKNFSFVGHPGLYLAMLPVKYMDFSPAPWSDFFSRYFSAKRGTMRMNAANGECTFISQVTGMPYSPCIMHFARDEAPFSYSWQLFKLFRRFNVPTKGLFRFAIICFYKLNLKLRLHFYKKIFKAWLERRFVTL